MGDRRAGTASGAVAYLHHGLAVARTTVVVVMLLGFCLPPLLGSLSLYPSPLSGLVWYAGMLAVALADGVLVALHRTWGWARLPVAGLVLALSWGAGAALPPQELLTHADWSVGAAGWFGVLLFGGTSVRALLVFIAAHIGLSALQLVLAGRADPATLVLFAVVVVAVSGLQVAAGLAGVAMRRVADLAAEAAARRAASDTAELVAAEVHADREARYAALRSSVLPLLRGIGDGTLPPSSEQVQLRAAAEAARMRRLFAEDADARDLLAAEIGALVDVVERRGIVVRFAARPVPADPPPDVRQALIDEVGGVLLSAVRTARVTLGTVGDDVVVSVVADGSAARIGRAGHRGDVRSTTVVDGGRTWVEARWAAAPV